MYEDSALDALFSLAEKRITGTCFFQLLKLTPAGKEEGNEDDWLDLVDVVLDRGLKVSRIFRPLSSSTTPMLAVGNSFL
jgi:hypothetical protein